MRPTPLIIESVVGPDAMQREIDAVDSAFATLGRNTHERVAETFSAGG